MSDTTIEIGNVEGKNFTQWRLDFLKEIADMLIERMPVQDVKLWYDAEYDFHNLQFTLDGRTYVVQKYKITQVFRDPKEGCSVCRFEGESRRFGFASAQTVIGLFAGPHKQYLREAEWM